HSPMPTPSSPCHRSPPIQPSESHADLLSPIIMSSGEASPEHHQDPVRVTPAPELAFDEDLEEVFGRPPQLAEKEHIWLGQTDDEGQPEVMDEAREEEVIKQLRQLAIAIG